MKRAATRSVIALTERLLLAAFLAGFASLFVYNDWLWRWDNLLYDAQLSFWKRPASEQIVIIAIDDASLSELGNWPWPRAIHARLLDHLTDNAQPAAIGLDIIFSEADRYRPDNDTALAGAISRSGLVVLPIYMTQKNPRSFPIEALPLPVLADNAAGLGHVHIDLSDDGIARHVFLYEGIGKPRWRHFSLALLEAAGRPLPPSDSLSRENSNAAAEPSMMRWSREAPLLIPYAGPPGHFQRIAYSQVLAGKYPPGFFDHKFVLIGATAEGMGDVLPTPFSGHSRAMPGIEINANILDALLQGIHLRAVDKPVKLLITLLLVLLPLISFQFLKPRSALLALLLIIVSTIGATGLLLWFFQLWLSPATAILFQLSSYPLWSWRRLEHAIRHLNHELDDLNRQRKKISIHRRTDIRRGINFMRALIPINGWALVSESDAVIMRDGHTPAKDRGLHNRAGWHLDSYSAWASIVYHKQHCRLGLSFELDSVISQEERQLLDQLLASLQDSEEDRELPGDFLDAKIRQIQLAETNLLKLRRFIDDGLSNMADGVIVCDACGEILLSNSRASWYLMGDDNARLSNLSLSSILEDIRLPGNTSWKPLLRKSLVLRERVITQAQHKSGRDLMVQISPLDLVDNHTGGLVINLSDIQLLKGSEKKRDELLNFLSHDLRSPLSATLALIELSKNKNDAGELHGVIEQIASNTSKTLHLAEQFLHLSRAKSNEDLPLYDIDFNTVVLNATEQMWTLAQAKKIQLSQSFSEEELWILGEPDLLERAIVNLISNAIKYSDNNTNVKVNVFTRQKNIYCCVIDEGYGISREDLPDLFELFKRVHRDGKKRKLGIGLGLAFVDAVAQRHGGHVDVESTAGLGSSFCLVIPYQPAA
ncbi:MAG TPA: CHASE2 domain-containing protein [Thiotrichales bacterium]|nr:CHASE2 domain-containing protein [Thiotrichales bacterium]